MKTWIAAKRGKGNILLQINQIAVFTPRLILRRFTEQNGVTRMMFLIPCNGESPLTTGTCFDYNACILHLQKVKQQNIFLKKTVVVFNLLRIHVQKVLL